MYYVVRKGKEIGIYNSLHQILEIHKGWEKDFEVCSYTTLKEARSTVVNTHISPKVVQGKKKKTKQQNLQKNLTVYVDGSYVKKNKRYGVGVLVVDNNKIVVEKAIQIPKPTQEPQLHEWYAVLEGLKALKGLSYDHAILYSDSSTICSLFNGAPIKIKKAYSHIYSAIHSQLKNKKITIAHVKSHNGNLYNERVDQLAGYASGTRNTLPTPSNKLVYKKDDRCFNHTIDIFFVSQSPFPKKMDIHNIIDPMDIDDANEILYKETITAKEDKRLTFLFQKTNKNIRKLNVDDQKEVVTLMRRFVRFYEFLLQVSCFEDVELHKKYRFIALLLAYVNLKNPGNGFNLSGKIFAMNFIQKKKEEHTKSSIKSKPIVKLPTADNFVISEDKEQKLSEIIAEINSIAGKSYDNDVAIKAMLQIKDIMMKSDKLKISAKNNTEKDFEFAYFDNIDEALIEGLEQNQDFFSLLLGNEEMKKKVLGIFSDEIYQSLKATD